MRWILFPRSPSLTVQTYVPLAGGLFGDAQARIPAQIAGAFHEYEKARLVAKLKAAARERKRAAVGKCEGRKSWAEINPKLVREAKRLRRRSPKGINARCVTLCEAGLR